jgi:glyoxylase-like metal-dependent hydrolase (beta-lactamase superfamily II)
MPVTRTTGLAAAMAQLGIAPEGVTHVVITHPHGDHYAGVTIERVGEMAVRFPRARHVMGRADWEGNAHRGEPDSDLERLEMVDRLGLLELVDDRLEIAPGVTVLAAPGESPGHCIVRLESAGEVCYFLGDVVHHACEIEHPEWAPPHADLETLLPTRRRVFADAAGDNALVVTTHERFPPWGRIVAAGDGYRWQRD